MGKPKASKWLDLFQDEPEDVKALLLDCRDELARTRAAAAGASFSQALNMINQLLDCGLIRFELRKNILDEVEGVDAIQGNFRAKAEAIKALRTGTIRV